MTDTPIDMGLVAAPPAPAQQTAPPAVPAAAKPEVAAPAHRETYEQTRQRQDQANAAAKPEAAADAEASVDPQAPAADGAKIKVGKFEVSEEQIASMMDRQAQEDLKKATLPSAPEAYKAELAADLKLPGGIEYKFNDADPSMVAARNWAHAKGLSQGEFSEVLGIYASHVAGEQAALAARSAAELAKVGVNAPQRVDAVGKFITAEMGEADAKQIRALIVTDSMLRYHEKIMQKLSSQGAASFSQQHRAAPDANGIPGYDKMTFEQRRQAQDQNAARRR